MAETTLLRTSAIVRNTSVGNSPPLGPPGAVKTGELPNVQVKKAPGAPQFMVPQAKPVEILPPRDASSALRTGGLPVINVKMTAQGPQLDDGMDKPVVILPPKRAVSAGGLPMVDVRMTKAGLQVQNMPAAAAVSQPRQTWGAAPPVHRPLVRVAAPKVEPALPPVPELTSDQLLLCRHLVGKYLTDLSAAVPLAQDSEQTADGGVQVVTDVTAAAAPDSGDATAGVSELLVRLVQETIETIDQALIAVAVRAEAAERAAAAAAERAEAAERAAAEAATAAATVAASPPRVVTAPGTSIIPAAPSASYVAGRVGGRPNPNGYARPQRNASHAPRGVVGVELPRVEVKMDGGKPIVQNQQEVAAARAARAARGAQPFTSEVQADLDGILPG